MECIYSFVVQTQEYKSGAIFAEFAIMYLQLVLMLLLSNYTSWSYSLEKYNAPYVILLCVKMSSNEVASNPPCYKFKHETYKL